MFIRAEASEKQLHGELNLPGRRSRGELALVGRVERFGDGAEVRMVRQIERFDAENLPAVQQMPGGSGQIARKRHFIGVARDEAVRDVETGPRLFGPPVALIADSTVVSE